MQAPAAVSLTEVVRGHDDLNASARNICDDVLDPLGRERIEACHRFVQEDELGIEGERPCQRDALLFAAREAACRPIGERCKSNLVQKLPDPGGCLRVASHFQCLRTFLAAVRRGMTGFWNTKALRRLVALNRSANVMRPCVG